MKHLDNFQKIFFPNVYPVLYHYNEYLKLKSSFSILEIFLIPSIQNYGISTLF